MPIKIDIACCVLPPILLDSSRMDSPYLHLEQVPHQLCALMKDIAGSARVYAEARALPFSYRTEVESARASCDENDVGRIVLNLLSNAIKHTPSGGHIIVSMEPADQFWRTART